MRRPRLGSFTSPWGLWPTICSAWAIPARALAVLGGLFGRPRNRFSYQFTDLVLVAEDVTGLLTSYPEKEIRRRDLSTGRQMIQIWARAIFYDS